MQDPTVFLSNENPRLDYSATKPYGTKLVSVFPPGRIHLSPSAAVLRARQVLSVMTHDDYLMLVGDPIAIAICAMIAGERLGRVKFLRFQRPADSPRTNASGYYEEIEVNFKAEEGAVDVVRLIPQTERT